MINQKYLKTFIKLVETQHFTQTAEQLFMTQPGVTQHIKKLEAELATPLLIRYGKHFELTLAGEKLYQSGLKMRELESALLQEIIDDRIDQGTCCIACSGALANSLYPTFVRRQQVFQQLVVRLEAAPNQKILNDLLNNNVDLAIVSVQSAEALLEQQLVGHEELQLVLPATIKDISSLGFKELNQLGFIDHPDGMHFAEKVLQANFSGQYQGRANLQVSGYVNQLQQILLPVAQGVGFTILPKRCIEQSEWLPQLSIFPLTQEIKEPLYLTQKRYRQLPARYQWFIDSIKEQLN